MCQQKVKAHTQQKTRLPSQPHLWNLDQHQIPQPITPTTKIYYIDFSSASLWTRNIRSQIQQGQDDGQKIHTHKPTVLMEEEISTVVEVASSDCAMEASSHELTLSSTPLGDWEIDASVAAIFGSQLQYLAIYHHFHLYLWKPQRALTTSWLSVSNKDQQLIA